MIAQSETLGVLSVGTMRTGGLSFAERRTLQTVTEQLSLALANLLLQDTLRQQSLRDALTGLFNRRYLEDALAREVGTRAPERGRRSPSSCSISIISSVSTTPTAMRAATRCSQNSARRWRA